MLKNGGGAIVNNSSVAGHVGMGGVSIYIASKHSVEGLTKSVALEFARQNIRVNAVAPGVIATDMFVRFAGRNWAIRSRRMIPVGRKGATEEIAAAALSLFRRRKIYHRDVAGCRRGLGSAINLIPRRSRFGVNRPYNLNLGK